MPNTFAYYDIFEIACKKENNKKECKGIREIKKCKDDVCKKESTVIGGGPDPELQYMLLDKLKNKYRCPFCKKYNYMEDVIAHQKSHVGEISKNLNIKRKQLSNIRPLHRNDKFYELQKGNGTLIGGKPQYYGHKSEIMVKVPENVKNVALYAFKLKKIGFEGARETGWKRAKQLSTKDFIPIEDLRYMRNWYARHVYTSYPTYKEWIKAGKPKDSKWHNRHGIIAWVTWGGDAAFKWVNNTRNINLLNKHYNKDYKKIYLK